MYDRVRKYGGRMNFITRRAPLCLCTSIARYIRHVCVHTPRVIHTALAIFVYKMALVLDHTLLLLCRAVIILPRPAGFRHNIHVHTTMPMSVTRRVRNVFALFPPVFSVGNRHTNDNSRTLVGIHPPSAALQIEIAY